MSKTMTLEQVARHLREKNTTSDDLLADAINAHLADREQVLLDVTAELEKATRKFPMWPTDPLHAVGVFNEEAGELSKAVLQQMYEPYKNQPDDVRKEALQAAAMALRFLANLDQYDWTPGAQHGTPLPPAPDKEGSGPTLLTRRPTSRNV